jgi:hypothetical protein
LLGSASADGPLTQLSDTIEEQPIPIQPFARRMITLEIAARGVHYLLLDPGDYDARQIFDDPGVWGLKELGEAGGGARLYYIEPAARAAKAAP